MSKAIFITGGEVIHPTSTEHADVIVRDGVIEAVGRGLSAPDDAILVDARGCWVGPGLVDLHTHLREPGREAAETIVSGSQAAALGGYSAVVAMPNTEPALDDIMSVSYVITKSAAAVVDVAIAGAITVNRAGHALAPMAELAAAGIRIFTDDGNGVQNAAVMRRAMDYARTLGVTLAQHCEDEHLAEGGVMNEGEVSARLGLLGRPAVSEDIMVERDIALSRLTGCPVHFLHISTAASLRAIAAAKVEGLLVTCEVAPHHFTLDETSLENYGTQFKVHPPLRTRGDRDAVRAALVTGVIDAVATDHAPHADELKELSFDEAPAGMLGLEHAASLTNEALGIGENPLAFFALLSRAPARIAQLRATDVRPLTSAHGGDVVTGEDANLVIFDPRQNYVVDRNALASRSRNTPYDGRSLTGRARATIVRGRLVVNNGELQ
jgi:dihydroorotase